MYGSLEITNKGNVHAHFLGKYREDLFGDLKFNNAEAKHVASAKIISANLKTKSICDVQVAKDKQKVHDYIMKDIDVTTHIIGRSPTYQFPIKSNMKPSETLEQITTQQKEVCTSCLDWEINIINDSFKK